MKKLFGQAVRFFGISGIGWIMDFVSFSVMSCFMGQGVFVYNIISSLLGALFVFLFSTKSVFKRNTGRIPLYLKLILYLVYIILLVLFVSWILKLLTAILREAVPVNSIVVFAPLLGKICITPVTMCANFFVMKGLVEKL